MIYVLNTNLPTDTICIHIQKYPTGLYCNKTDRDRQIIIYLNVNFDCEIESDT